MESNVVHGRKTRLHFNYRAVPLEVLSREVAGSDVYFLKMVLAAL